MLSVSRSYYPPIPPRDNDIITTETVKWEKAQEGYLSFSKQLTIEQKMELFPKTDRSQLEKSHVILRQSATGYEAVVMREGDKGWTTYIWNEALHAREIALVEKFKPQKSK